MKPFCRAAAECAASGILRALSTGGTDARILVMPSATAYSPYSRHHRHLEGWHGLLGLQVNRCPCMSGCRIAPAGPAHVMRYAPGDERKYWTCEANATAAVLVSNRFDRLRDQTDAPVATEARAGPVATQAPDSVTTIRGTSYLGTNVRGMKIASNIMKAVNQPGACKHPLLRSAGDLMDPTGPVQTPAYSWGEGVHSGTRNRFLSKSRWLACSPAALKGKRYAQATWLKGRKREDHW
jgi:hypothetical protein